MITFNLYIKNSILFLFLFPIISCSNKFVGKYGGEFKSELKYLSSSSLELKEDHTFILKYNVTTLDFPQGSINEILGNYKIKNNKLILIPAKRRIAWVEYGIKNNENNTNLRESLNGSTDTLIGSRATALMAIDTVYGEYNDFRLPKIIEMVKHVRSNSIYFVNQDNCFWTFIKSQTFNDLTNYCSELSINK